MEHLTIGDAAVASRIRSAAKKYKQVDAIDLIKVAVATDWKQLERATIPIANSTKNVRNPKGDVAARFNSALWAYLPAQDTCADTNSNADLKPSEMEYTTTVPLTRSRKRMCTEGKLKGSVPVTPLRKASICGMAKGLERLFGKANEKSHLFRFHQNAEKTPLKGTLDSVMKAEDSPNFNSQYTMTALEECERFERLSSYEDSVSSDITSYMDDPKTPLSDDAPEEVPAATLEALRQKCEGFFDQHGLVVKVRKLPAEGSIRKSLPTSDGDDTKDTLCYPAYHFVSRQRAHMLEQIMRGRTFLDTRCNSSSELRNAKSPFTLVEVRDFILKLIESLTNDMADPDFSGIYISVSTKAFVSNSEFGPVRRTKTIAWAMIELLTSNERCLRGIWVHPTISASGTTALLSALLPYSIMTSFMISPAMVDNLYPVKTFCVWLNDFDMFPRQTLVLLTSLERFGLIKHHDLADNLPHAACCSSECVTCTSNFKLSHVDTGVSEETCFCHESANWDDLDHVIVSCTEQLMENSLQRWIRLVPDQAMPELLDDMDHIVMPESVSYTPIKTKELHSAICDAEYTGLSHTEIRVGFL
ncbi:uncharacterized protein BXIN_0049 [Babesia sp. Xinjiang]|uniref:uncharacterized protein n=1 Tax=Babesia sp. Xinjiang TaxID=462227 RepID=UPI000A23D56D|nr:uncharacterized protein BXIN_0049 [Babesia sp. Xinjiang]ORM39715.1 hypothetical protein BXIN_0049 [Babesia sp. Xinjiang]